MRASTSPAPRSRILARCAGTAPIQVWMLRSGPWPCRANRARPSSSFQSVISAKKGPGFRLDLLDQQALRA